MLRTFAAALVSAVIFSMVFAAGALGQANIRQVFAGANPSDEFGSVVDGVGDIDGDGFADVIVGAPFDLPGSGHPGSATIYSGSTGAILFALVGPYGGSGFGLGAASAGDVDNDGVLDVIVGMSNNGSSGAGPGGGASILSGVDGSLIRALGGTIANDGFGQYVASLGDIDDDGHDDVLVGTAFAPNAAQPGYANVYSGFDGSILYAKSGAFNGHRFGLAYRGCDVDGDGVREFMIGALGGNVNGANSGSLFVYSGASGVQIYDFHGVAANDRLGYSASGIGDIDGDSFGEIIVGTYVPNGAGYARIYSGATGAVLHHLTDGVIGDAFGHTVAGVGDVNGDGTPDFAVAATNSNVNGTQSGFVRVFSGATATILQDFPGPGPNVHFGYAISAAGDVNGDALPDIAIGSLVTGGAPGYATVVSICAAQPFGAGLLPTQTLSMFWINGAPGHESEGGPAVSGAAPGSPGILAANLSTTSVTISSVPVLVDPSPGILLFDIFFDGAGYFEAAVNLRDPSLAGVSLYTQTFELNALAPEGVFASNGLALHFGN